MIRFLVVVVAAAVAVVVVVFHLSKECGSDFVEMMFKIMQAPLSSVLGLCKRKRGQDLNPLMSMQKSLSDLDQQSFVKGELPDDALPKPVNITNMMTQKGQTLPTPDLTPGYQQVNAGQLKCDPCGYTFNANQQTQHQYNCPSCRLAKVKTPGLKPGYQQSGIYLRCESCNKNFAPHNYPTYDQACPLCKVAQTKKPETPETLLKDNCKFMVTDSLQVFEASTIRAMELMKDVDCLRDLAGSSRDSLAWC